MTGRIVVMHAGRVSRHWLAQQDVTGTLAAEGARLFRQLGCSGCHARGSAVRAPPLRGLYGRPVPLQRRHDRDRRRQLHPRFDPAAARADRRRLSSRVMPSFAGKIERGRTHPAGRLHQVAGRRREARTMTDAIQRNYLTADNRLRSWFFTTDHKRIAILYFAGITLFFFIGGAAATLIRLELATPRAISSPPTSTTGCSRCTAS